MLAANPPSPAHTANPPSPRGPRPPRAAPAHTRTRQVCRQRADSDRACRRLLLAGPAGPDGAGAEGGEGMEEGAGAGLDGPAPASEWGAAAGAVQRAWGMRLQGQGRLWAGLAWLAKGGAAQTVADLAMRVPPPPPPPPGGGAGG